MIVWTKNLLELCPKTNTKSAILGQSPHVGIFGKDWVFLCLFNHSFFSSMRLERLRGKKSSSCGIRQLLLQLREWWRGRKDGVHFQSDCHHRDHHHRRRKGDYPADHGCQKWEGSFHKVLVLLYKKQQLLCLMCPPCLAFFVFPPETFFLYILKVIFFTILLLHPSLLPCYHSPTLCLLLSRVPFVPEFYDLHSDGMLYFRRLCDVWNVTPMDLKCSYLLVAFPRMWSSTSIVPFLLILIHKKTSTNLQPFIQDNSYLRNSPEHERSSLPWEIMILN